jgi:putative addiction module component (TIGR02574 family)
MTENAERVTQDVLQLPEADRAELARLLIESLDASEDPDAEAARDAELSRRVERVEQGKQHIRPAHQVLEEIRDKYK